MANISDVSSLPFGAGEDTFELHALQSELESVEKQIHDLLLRQAELRDRCLALETSRADAHKCVYSVRILSIGRNQPWSRSLRLQHATTKPGWFRSGRRKSERDAVIIGDSIVRHVHATLGKSKVHSHCFPGARVSEIAARVPEILNGDERFGTVVLHAGVNDIRLRQTEILKKDFRNRIDTSATAESIATALKERLASILPEDQKSKLICQAYDGASMMRGATAGVQRKVQDVYPNTHYIHCYVHQLNLIMQQATSHISKTRIFFSNIGGFASFFSKSPKRTCFLDKVVAHRLPRSSNVRWNFHSRAINTVFEHREDLIHCFESIQESGDFDPNTVREAGALAMLLEDDDFKFFLELYHHIMPHVDFLYAKLQKKNIDSVHIKVSIQQFQQEIQKIRNSLHSIGEQSSGSQPAKRRRVLSPEERERIGAEVCDTILGHTRERFSFTDHLVCATLLQGDRFDEYKDTFPDDALSSTIRAYPMLNGSKLKTELSLIYSKQEFSACRGAVDLFQLFMES
ncbi:unnamed protein product [Leuciscus chuanchicus]